MLHISSKEDLLNPYLKTLSCEGNERYVCKRQKNMGLIDNFQNVNEMLKQVQHDTVGKTLGACHPEPGPELDSGSTISGSRF
jgi:hypothetical protein